jgi:hypothetical protein
MEEHAAYLGKNIATCKHTQEKYWLHPHLQDPTKYPEHMLVHLGPLAKSQSVNVCCLKSQFSLVQSQFPKFPSVRN